MEQPIAQTGAAETWFHLEEQEVFSRSLIWDFQYRYYAEKGVDAWRRNEVPYYITTNATIANSYAEILFSFLCDQHRLIPGKQSDEPLYVCELGAGSGRFAFHLLSRLSRLCEMVESPGPSFCYVLTDFIQSNLDFWRSHPRFEKFFASGVLDVAMFDIKESDHLALQGSGRHIAARSLNRPLAVIANYVLDSVPPDLFYLDDKRCHQCLLSLVVDDDPNKLTATQLMERLRYHYKYREFVGTPYAEPYLQRLFTEYQQTLSDTHLLFPAAGLRCLDRLKSLSNQGMLLLSADKGNHQLETLRGAAAPTLVGNAGSFSLDVNYHAFKRFCEHSGGLAFFPSSNHNFIDISALLMVPDASSYLGTQRAYLRHVQDFSPDDFFMIVQNAVPQVGAMQISDILAHLRLGYYDSYHFGRYFLPRLQELVPELNCDQRKALAEAINRVWGSYFPLGEEQDLAYQMGCLLYEMEDYPLALTYFEYSIEIYGQHTGTLFNMSACYRMLGQSDDAHALLHQVLKHDPYNQPARELLAASAAQRVKAAERDAATETVALQSIENGQRAVP